MPYLRFKGFDEGFLRERLPEFVEAFSRVAAVPRETVEVELLSITQITATHISPVETNKNCAGRLLLTACFISFVCFFGSYMRILIVPLFATALGADTVQVGLINGAFMLMAGALSIPSGLISD